MALLSLLIFLQPFGEYAAVWEQARLWPVMLAYGLTVPMVLLRAWQAACLARLQRISVGFGSLVGLQLATTFYGLFAPGIVAAGMLRWYRLARLSGETGATLALVVFSRMLEIEIALLLGLCFWLADSAAPGAPALPMAFAGLFLVLFMARYAAFHPQVAAVISGLVSRWWPVGRLARLRAHLLDLLAVTGRYGTLTGPAWATLLLNILAGHMLGLLSVGLIALAVGMDVGWATLGWARAVLALALLLPITWAGIGLREATLAVALVAAGQPAAAAVTMGLLLSLRVLIEACAGGLGELHAWLANALQEKRLSS